jgi:sortase (surface protein transpeptidase)
MVYAQALTPGFRIIFEAQNKSYEYHTDYKRIVGPEEVMDVQ